MDKQTQKEILKIVQCNYTAIAKSFAETRKKQIWPKLTKLAEHVKPEEAVLDVGCGNGRLFQLFKDKHIKYLGVDDCQELLETGKEMYKNNPNQPKFIKGNILELTSIPEIDFDYIFCIAVLHHLPGEKLRVQALKQLKNKVAAEGKIIISVWNLWSQIKYRKLICKFFFLKLLKKNKMDFGDILFDWKDPRVKIYTQRYYHAFTRKQLRQIAEQAGLKIDKLYKDRFNYYLILSK